MKKLMIALAAVAMAAGVQAAQVDWKVAYKGVNWKDTGYTAVLFNSSQLESLTTLFADFTGKTAADVSALAYTGDAFEFTTYSAKNGGSTTGTAVAAKGASASESAIAVIFKGDIKAGTDFEISSAKALSDYVYEQGSGAPGTLSFNGAADFVTSGTITVAPEPTSGLLLLIGMAGLALRRRRA